MPAVDAPQQQQPMEALSQEGIVTQQVVSIPVFFTLSATQLQYCHVREFCVPNTFLVGP